MAKKRNQSIKQADATLPDAIPPAALAAPGGKLLNRSEVARRLNLSRTTVRRMEGTTLQPILGPNGVRYFLEEHVEAVFVRTSRMQPVERGHISGTVAAKVFERLRAGMNAVDVVKELRLDPECVERLVTDWQRLSTTLVLDATQIKTVRRALRSAAITDGPSFLAGIASYKRDAIDHCQRCGSAVASYCLQCARALGRRELKQEEASRLF